ncbi:MAG: 16S rRNA (adenine(1518)-N(6)/adenine(1519)-N(6))-dimethyltransferase RsmA [Methanomicrobiales archaeon]|jgi:16S rRNA (adenine1518-N6/adenine1519-N6)-dimethyltransferase|nr:16S rRNA (adenine(1518)-N(6)/adenine(1519)-N(6))-dimethyltransferase RsmA [Methanomicrobiales archaeon]
MRAWRDQHFLTNPHTAARIVDCAQVAEQGVLEIGPGRGALTVELLSRGAIVHAVEIDPILAQEVIRRFSDAVAEGRLHVTVGDATRCPLPSCSLVVSNLPYSVSSLILFRLLAIDPGMAVLMVQREFAMRMVAEVGTPACGRLSVMLQTFAGVVRCFDVPPAHFTPVPQVWSTVVRVTPRPPQFPIRDLARYADLVRVLFSHRRKTVRNCIRYAGGELDVGWTDRVLNDLPPKVLEARPEALVLEDFALIANIP